MTDRPDPTQRLKGKPPTVSYEIQVYAGDIEPVDVFGLTWHNNYAVSGTTAPEYPGALVDNHAIAARWNGPIA